MMNSEVANKLQQTESERDTEVSVKNTFLHFDGRTRGNRVLQRNQTDPGGECPQVACLRLLRVQTSITSEVGEELVGCTGGTDSPRTPSPSPSPRIIDTQDVAKALVVTGSTQACSPWQPQLVCSSTMQGYWIPVPETLPKTVPETIPESRPPPSKPVLRANQVAQSAITASAPVRGITFVKGGLGVLYTFTLRLAPGCGLGLDLHRIPVPDDRLIVKQVLSQGAVEAWNRQAVANGASSGKAVVPGDRIVRVNGSEDCEGMLEECHKATKESGKAMLLKLFFVRGVAEEAEIKEWLKQS